jgi:hypothetical protein
MEDVCMVCSHLIYFMAIWYILWTLGILMVIWYIFPRFEMLYQE